MTDLKLIPKPEGYEFRDKLSEKANDAALWQPTDALFDASAAMKDRPIHSAIVVWSENLPDGARKIHFRHSGPEGTATTLIVHALGRLMGWAP